MPVGWAGEHRLINRHVRLATVAIPSARLLAPLQSLVLSWSEAS